MLLVKRLQQKDEIGCVICTMVKTSHRSLWGILGSDARSQCFILKRCRSVANVCCCRRCRLLLRKKEKKIEPATKWRRHSSPQLPCACVFAACGDAAVNNLHRIYQHMRHTQALTLFTLWPHVALQSLLFISPVRFLSSGVWFVSVCLCIFIVALHCL